jgi:hypothetical protein
VSEERHQLAPARPPRVIRLAQALAEDAIGLVGYGLVCAGVHVVWGAGWTMLAAGLSMLAIYVWRELRAIKRASARGDD